MTQELTFEYICKQAGCLNEDNCIFTKANLQFAQASDVPYRRFCAKVFAVVLCVKGTIRFFAGVKEYTLESNMALVIHPNMEIRIIECEDFTARGIFFNPLRKGDVMAFSHHMPNMYLWVMHNPIIELSDTAYNYSG